LLFGLLLCQPSDSQLSPGTHSSPQAHVLAYPSCLLAGARASAAGAGPPPPSSPLRRSSSPGDLPSIFPRPHASSRRSTLLRIAPFLTVVRAPATTPHLRRCRHSPATSPADPSPPINRGWAQSQFPVACLPARAPPRRRRARHLRRDQGGWGIEGIFVKSLEFPGAQMHKDSSLLCVLWLKLVKSIKNSKPNFVVLV
jgi:hypothetical protein